MLVVSTPGCRTLKATLFFKRIALLGVMVLIAWSSRVGAEDAIHLREVPFAPRSVKTGQTLFSEVSPAASGVVTENSYADPRMWSDLYQEFVYGAIGTGVAIGDFDSDGWPDVFVVSKIEGSRLFSTLR